MQHPALARVERGVRDLVPVVDFMEKMPPHGPMAAPRGPEIRFFAAWQDHVGLKNYEVAERVGVDPASVSRWRRRKRCEATILPHLERLFGLKPGELNTKHPEFGTVEGTRKSDVKCAHNTKVQRESPLDSSVTKPAPSPPSGNEEGAAQMNTDAQHMLHQLMGKAIENQEAIIRALHAQAEATRQLSETVERFFEAQERASDRQERTLSRLDRSLSRAS